MLYLNPPYDWEAGSSNNQRLEPVFLEHSYRWLKPGGVLIFVIPQLRLGKCARLLSEEFRELRVYRLTEPACVQYKQIVVLGTRRKRHARLADSALMDQARWLEGLSTRPRLEPLTENPEIRCEVPGSGPLALTHVGIPLDESRICCSTQQRIARPAAYSCPSNGTYEGGHSGHCLVDSLSR